MKINDDHIKQLDRVMKDIMVRDSSRVFRNLIDSNLTDSDKKCFHNLFKAVQNITHNPD